MLLKQLIENDLRNCYEAMQSDGVLKELEKEFYEKCKDVDGKEFIRIEEIFSQLISRTARIAYLQGMKDFNELCLVLREDTADIMKNYIDG